MERAGVLLIGVALIAGMVGCAVEFDPAPVPPVEHHLVVSSDNGGWVTTPGEGTFSYNPGSVVDLVAEAEEGYQFVNWTGDVDTVADVDAAATAIIINGDYSITANFEGIAALQYDLSISSTDGGSVTTPGEGVFACEEGTVVNLVVGHDSGYVFAGWTGDVDTIANVNAASTTITVNDNYSIEANFEKVPEVFARELVSWWRAEGDATDAWGDNHGVLMNEATFGEGKVAEAFRLDGVDDWVMVPSAPTLNFGTEDFTVCLWVNFTDPDPEQVMIEKYVETFGSPERIGWTFTKLDSTMVRLHLGPGHWSVVDAAASITANTWHFAAVSRSENTYRIYWDGTLIGSASWEDNFNLDSDASLKIGHRGDPDDTPGSEDDSGYYLAGLVDEIQVFRSALSDEDILYLFNSPILLLEPAT